MAWKKNQKNKKKAVKKAKNGSKGHVFDWVLSIVCLSVWNKKVFFI